MMFTDDLVICSESKQEVKENVCGVIYNAYMYAVNKKKYCNYIHTYIQPYIGTYVMLLRQEVQMKMHHS